MAREKSVRSKGELSCFSLFSSTIEGTSTRRVDDDLNLRNLVVDS